MLHGHLHRCVLGCLPPPAIVHRWGRVGVSHDGSRPHHGQLPVSLHEVLEERLSCVSKGDTNVDDFQLLRRADKFVCCQAAFYAQVVMDMNLDLTFVGYGNPSDPCGAVLVSYPGEDGGEARVGHLGFQGLFLPQHGVLVTPRHDRYVLQVRSFGCIVLGAWFVEGHEGDERIDDVVGVRPDGPWRSPCAARS